MKSILKSRILYGVIAAAFALSSCSKDNLSNIKPVNDAVKSNTGAMPLAPGFKLIGYLPTWQGNVNTVQYSKLTHINYAFLIPNTNGTIQNFTGGDLTKFQTLITNAHNNGVKVLISVGGGGGGDAFHTIVASSSLRTTFVNSMVSFCNTYNVDGVDVDWEFPSAGTEANNFTTMMQSLTTAMHNIGKLSTIASISTGASYVTSTLISTLDWINVMDYDDNNYQHSTYQSAVDCLSYWAGRGLPKAKTILGLPFYARDNTQGYATVNYNSILSMGGSANSDTYAGRYGYNGIPTVQAKTTLAMSQAGGIMMWDLGGDATGANSLLSAIFTVASSGGSTPPSSPPFNSVISLKGFNGKFVSGENGTTAMTCTRTTDGDWEHFTVLNDGSGNVRLRSMGKYVSSENGTQAMTANRATPGAWETFQWATNADGTVTLKCISNNKYVSSENGTQPITCNRATASGWESFTVTVQ